MTGKISFDPSFPKREMAEGQRTLIQMTKLKGALMFLVFLLLFLALFGSLSPTEAQQLKKVHAAIPAITPAAAPFAIAKDRGFYREEGLDVDLIVMPSAVGIQALDRKSTRLNSSHLGISYAVFCLKKKK